MSIISDALQKAQGSGSELPPSGKRSGTGPLLPAGLMVLAAIGLAAWAWLAGDDSPTRAASAAGAGTPESPRLFSLRSAESAWRLSGVIESRKGRSLALINGKWIEEGQTTADGARVVRVEKRQVALERDGALETVTLR